MALKESPQQEKILQELAMDVLRILTTPDLEVRKKTLNLGNAMFTGYFRSVSFVNWLRLGVATLPNRRE